MSFSSGAYFGSHSTLSQWARWARAARDIWLVWIGPLSRTSTIGVIAAPSLGPERRSTSSRRAMKSELRLVRAGAHDERAPGPIEHAEHRPFGALAQMRPEHFG